MSSPNSPPPSNAPVSMGPGAQPVRPGEPNKSLLQEITEIRSKYSIHVDATAIDLAYKINDQQRTYRLPFDNIPLHGITRATAYGGPNSARTSGTLLIDIIRAMENIQGRPVTQQEAEGIAYYTTKRTMYNFYGGVTGMGIGYYLAWRRRSVMKFPFMTPKLPERYEKFPNRFLPILRGQYARIMWQITRFNVYAVLGLFAIAPFARSMGDVSMTVGLYRDSRTHDLAASVKARGNLDRLRSNRSLPSASKVPQAGSGEKPSQEGEDAGQQFYGGGGGSGGESYGSQQDYVSETSFSEDSTNTDVMTDTTTQQSQPSRAIAASWGKPRAQNPSVASQSQSSSEDFFFDDASPTAGNDPDMATPKPITGGTPRSAWDRVRRGGSQRGNRQTAQQSRSQQQALSQGGENSGNSFSFSKYEEERQLAKDQAQKDFDAMIERERREGGSAEYNKGMKATEAGFESPQSTGSAWEGRRRG